MSFDKVPEQLTAREQWVMWKHVTRDGDKTKLPFQTSGTMAKSNDSSTWNAFENCAPVAGSYSGIGFVFSEDDPFVGVDLDGCRDPETGEIADWAKAVIGAFDSYSEVSPSQTGVKIFTSGEWSHGGKKVDVDAENTTGKMPGIEVYSSLRYFAVTGQRIAVSPNVEHRQEQLDWLYTKHFAQSSRPAPAQTPLYTDDDIVKRAAEYVDRIEPAIAGQSGHNQTFKTACCLVLGFGLSPEEAFPLLSIWNQKCQPMWSERELWHKLNSANKQTGERNYIRDAKREDWSKISVPRYTESGPTPPPKSPLEISTLKDAAFAALERAVTCGEIERISTGITELDEAMGGGYEKGEMIIVAARPSHGKTAVSMQMMYAAADQGMNCLMVSEEMSIAAIGKRVLQYASAVDEKEWHERGEEMSRDIDNHFQSKEEIHIVTGCRTANRVVEEIEKAVEERGVDLVVIDYAQKLKSEGNTDTAMAAETCSAIDACRKRLGITVLVLCQMNRDIDGRKKYLPVMSDIKQSSQFEQDADVIVFLVWNWKLDPKCDKREYFIFLAKNRNRDIAKPVVKATFDGARQKVIPHTHHDESDAPIRYTEFDDWTNDDSYNSDF